jgi:hypothetical protein
MFSTVGALIVIACAAPAPSRAATPPTDAGAVAEAPAPGCHCPRAQYRHARRVHHHVRRHARAPIALLPAPPPAYDPPIPSPWDPAYDRAMTLHFRSPEVSGTYTGEPGFPHTPPVHGIQSYRVQTGAAVLQYDGLTGQYIQLARVDALRAFPPAPAAAVPAPAVPAPPPPPAR